MSEQDCVVQTRDMLLAAAIGTEAVLALIPPWCGLGWGPWVVYLGCATCALLIAARYVWSR